MQRPLARFSRIISAPSTHRIIIRTNATTRNAEQPKSQSSKAQSPAPQNKNAPIEEPGTKDPMYAKSHAPKTEEAQWAPKSIDNRHAYGQASKPQEVKAEAAGVQQEKEQEKDTVKPKSNKDPRGLQ